MEHKSQDELAKILEEATRAVKVGARYQHYKQQYYRVEGIAILEATNEPMVVYRAEYNKRLAFIRPLSVWQETVEWQDKIVPRFKKVPKK